MAGAWTRSALLLLVAGLVLCAATTTAPADPPPPPPTPVADTTPPMEEAARSPPQPTAAHLLKKMFAECVRLGSFACVKPKVLSFLSSAAKKDKIFLTEDMSIERTSKYLPDLADYQKVDDDMSLEEVVRRADAFLAAHQLRMRLPEELVSGSAAPYVPKFLLRNLPAEVTVPLADNLPAAGQERGFVKRIVMPFLLGLKFKATALVPLALALIALKTWKALTLGLLSLVLSGAMLAFKLTKPKVVNYEVYHYPQHDHTAPAAAAYDPHHHGWGRRSLEAADIAYRGYLPAPAAP